MNASKDKGTAWETEVVRYLVSEGWPHVERRTMNGVRDRGDISGLAGLVIEAKNEKRYSLAEYMNETEAERRNSGVEFAVTWMHRAQKSSAADGYVVMPGSTFVHFLRAAGW